MVVLRERHAHDDCTGRLGVYPVDQRLKSFLRDVYADVSLNRNSKSTANVVVDVLAASKDARNKIESV